MIINKNYRDILDDSLDPTVVSFYNDKKKSNEPINGTASLVAGVISATILKKNTIDSKIVISANNFFFTRKDYNSN